MGQNNYTELRSAMVQNQLVQRGIKSQKVLAAMSTVQRQRFVPPELVSKAYYDCPLPIGYSQTISQPYVVAFMTEILDLKASDNVLEIGTGSGYQAAILAEICDSVFSIEVVEPLAIQAKKVINELNYKNIFIKTGDGYKGWPEHAPYNAIIVTCSPTHVPKALKDQLAEGGKIIIPVEKQYGQELVLLNKESGKIKRKNVLPVRFVPMVNDKGVKY